MHVHLQLFTHSAFALCTCTVQPGRYGYFATLPDGEIAARNSRHPPGPALIYTRAEISAFLAGARADEFDDLA
jgi:Domain of unknown function (DUF397)